MTNAWDHDWRKFIARRLSELGYATLRNFAADRPQATFSDLASELGQQLLAPIQIQESLKEQYEADGKLGDYYRDSLFRYLRDHVPNGIRSRGDWPLILAISTWAGSLGPELQAKAGRVARAVKRLPQEYSNWFPSSPHDELLEELFRKEGL